MSFVTKTERFDQQHGSINMVLWEQIRSSHEVYRGRSWRERGGRREETEMQQVQQLLSTPEQETLPRYCIVLEVLVRKEKLHGVSGVEK